MVHTPDRGEDQEPTVHTVGDTNATLPSSALLQHQEEPQQPANAVEKQHSAQPTDDSKPTPKKNTRFLAKFRSNLGRATEAHVSLVAVILSILVPFVALITWVSRRQVDGSSFGTIFDTFAGEKVGGSLTQSQAKAIDVLAGAILAPLVAAGFDFILFGSARVSVVSERGGKLIPLRSLVTVSTSSSGSYNPFGCDNHI